MNYSPDSIWIPAQSTSTRCKLKNYRPFFGDECLLQLLLKKLTFNFPESQVVISADRPELVSFDLPDNVRVGKRPNTLLGNDIEQSDLIDHYNALDSELFGQTSPADVILIAQCTDPLFFSYQELLNFYFKEVKGGGAGVFSSFPLKKQMFKDGQCIHGSVGTWHKVTQRLGVVDLVRWSGFVATRYEFLKCGYQIVPGSVPFRCYDYLVDIDDEEEFHIAQSLYRAVTDKSFDE